jgi:hypothetical protein
VTDQARWVTLRLTQDELDLVVAVMQQRAKDFAGAASLVPDRPDMGEKAETLLGVSERLDTAWGMAQR